MGAKIIEKHITLDTKMKGTDHPGSADIETFTQMVHNLRAVEFSLGDYKIERNPSVEEAKTKLERSLAVNKNLPKGHVLTESDIHMISPGNGYKWNDRYKFIGVALPNDIEVNTLL